MDMGNLGLISLAALLAAIILGFIRKANVGIICIGISLVLGMIYGITEKEIMAGFSTSLFLTMAGVTYLFSILSTNQTLNIMAKKITSLAGSRTYLIPVTIYVIGFLLCAVGPGAIPTLAIIPVLAVPIALSAGLNPIMLSLIGQMGVQSGRMTKLTPEGILVMELMEQQGISSSLVPVFLCLLMTEVALVACIYVYYKGWRVKKTAAVKVDAAVEKLNHNQWISLAGLFVLVICVTVLEMNVGLTAFLIGTALIVLGAGDEGKSIRAIPWNVLLLVMGVGILMNIVVISGGIDILSNLLVSIMGPKTSSAIMVITAGFMSFFSSGLGVVFPTLIPTAGPIAETFAGGVSPVELVAMVVAGGTVTGFSPISTAGSLIMAAVSSDTGKEVYSQNKMFIELFGVAILALIVSAILAITGIYALFC